MSQIIDINNKPLTSKPDISEDDIANAQQPKAHEPRWYRRRARLADERFHQIFAEFKQDMEASKTPGTTVDREAVKREYGHQWAKYAAAELKGPEPIPLNVNAMHEAIENAYKLSDDKARLDRLFNSPLHLLNADEMQELGWAKVFANDERTVYLSTQAYFVVGKSGLVRVSPRPANTSDTEWFWNLGRNPQWELPNYTIAEFTKLVVGLRLTQPVVPAAETIELAKRAFATTSDDNADITIGNNF